jgi:hypothetical protein
LDHQDDVIDSCPIKITSKHQCKQSKTANEIATHSFCASKEKFYDGIKLHMIAICQHKKLTIPCFIAIFEGFDIKTLECTELKNMMLYADLAPQSDSRHCNFFFKPPSCD